jgi:hypothetical protein
MAPRPSTMDDHQQLSTVDVRGGRAVSPPARCHEGDIPDARSARRGHSVVSGTAGEPGVQGVTDVQIDYSAV